MENASKALIIAAEVLIGVLLLTLAVYLFNQTAGFSKTIDDNIEMKNIAEFNVQFTTYEKKNNLTAQDVITLGNLARDYNKTEEGQNANRQIKVLVQDVESSYQIAHNLTDEKTYEFIQKYSMEKQATFTCTKIVVEKTTGRVNRIEIKLNKTT